MQQLLSEKSHTFCSIWKAYKTSQYIHATNTAIHQTINSFVGMLWSTEHAATTTLT